MIISFDQRGDKMTFSIGKSKKAIELNQGRAAQMGLKSGPKSALARKRDQDRKRKGLMMHEK